jgi:hypothetical protein
MKKLLLIMVLFVMGCGGNPNTDPAVSRMKVKEDYYHRRERAGGVRIVVVEDTKSGKSYFIWNDEAIIELNDK